MTFGAFSANKTQTNLQIDIMKEGFLRENETDFVQTEELNASQLTPKRMLKAELDGNDKNKTGLPFDRVLFD